VRTQSGAWRLGAARALKTERAPSSQTLFEAVRIAEAESLAELANTIEAKETHAVLAEYRDEKLKSAPHSGPGPDVRVGRGSDRHDWQADCSSIEAIIFIVRTIIIVCFVYFCIV
jgi:hypothetical protein